MKIFKKLCLSVALVATLIASAIVPVAVLANAEETSEETSASVSISESVADEIEEEHKEEEGTEELPAENVADNTENTADNVADAPENAPENGFISGVVEYLKTEYGEEYEQIYALILDRYGSFEAWIDGKIAETENDTALTAWQAFKAWLDEYKTIVFGILAGVAVVVVLIVGKYASGAMRGWVAKICKGSNSNTKALIAIMEGQNILFGDNEKYKAQKELNKKCIEELSRYE